MGITKQLLPTLGVAFAVATICTTASATDFTETRTVAFIRVHSTAVVGAHNDWFALTGLSSLGACGTNLGSVVIKLPDRNTADYKAMMTVLQAAKLAARQVKVLIRDNHLTNGFCTAAFIDF